MEKKKLKDVSAKEIFKKDCGKMGYPMTRLMDRKRKQKNKRGQMLIVGILIVVMALLVFIATLPATKDLINNARGCSYLNCGGYIDPDASGGASCTATNQTYTSTLEEDSLSCTILDLAIPFLILGVLIALIYKITRGDAVEPQPQFGGYPGY